MARYGLRIILEEREVQPLAYLNNKELTNLLQLILSDLFVFPDPWLKYRILSLLRSLYSLLFKVSRSKRKSKGSEMNIAKIPLIMNIIIRL